jgi:methionine-rich copper-binding protein CopC
MRGVVAVLLVGAAALLGSAAAASAHDALSSTSPSADSVVGALPEVVVLTFDQPALAIGTEVIVTGPNGPVTQGSPQLVDTEVRQPVRGGPAGRYTVVWRVTSADGHPVSGTFAFTTEQARVDASGSAGPSVTATSSGSGQGAASPDGGGPVLVWGVAVVALLVAAFVTWTAVRRRAGH